MRRKNNGAAEPYDDGGKRYLMVRHLPEAAKGYTWFKRYSAVGEVTKASFYGFRKGQVRWCVAEAASPKAAAALVKELQGKDVGADKPIACEVISSREKEDLEKQGSSERWKETHEGRTMKRSRTAERNEKKPAKSRSND